MCCAGGVRLGGSTGILCAGGFRNPGHRTDSVYFLAVVPALEAWRTLHASALGTPYAASVFLVSSPLEVLMCELK